MRKKILFTSPNLKSGGAQRHLINIINSLNSSDFDISLFLFSNEGELINEIKKNIRIFHPVSNSLSKTFKPAAILFGILELIRVIRKERPLILYSRHWCKIPNSLLGRSLSVYSVSGEGNNIRETLLNKNLKLRVFYYLRKLGLKYTDHIIANSKSLSDELDEVFNTNSKTEVIYNGVDIREINEKSREKINHQWLNENVPVLISVGRLSRQKGHRDLIEAVSLLRPEIDIRLIIMGEGKIRQELIDYSDDLGIKDSVDIISNKSNPFPYIKNSDIFVCPSRYEGLSNVILEASALGMPVVSTDHKHGANEIIENGVNGILVPVGDSKSLAGAIKKLINDKKLMEKIGSGARKNSEEFSLEKLGNNYKRFFNRIKFL